MTTTEKTKHYSRPFLMALMGLALVSPAQAKLLSNLYVSAATGVTITNDADFEQAGVTGDIEIDNTANFALALGKSINDNVRAEIEVSHRNADLDTLNIDGVGSASIGGDLKTKAVLLNGYYDFNPDNKFSPYLSAGIGLARHDGELTGGVITTSADDTVFAYQIGGWTTTNPNGSNTHRNYNPYGSLNNRNNGYR